METDEMYNPYGTITTPPYNIGDNYGFKAPVYIEDEDE